MSLRRVLVLPALLVTLFAVSCAATDPLPPDGPIPAARLLASDKYTLRVERGRDRVEVAAPDSLCGVAVEFSQTGQYMTVGDIRIPMSEKSAAPWRDWLTLAYPEDAPDKTAPTDPSAVDPSAPADSSAPSAPSASADSSAPAVTDEFDCRGAHFVFYSDGSASVTRGGVTRTVKITAEEDTPDDPAATNRAGNDPAPPDDPAASDVADDSTATPPADSATSDMSADSTATPHADSAASDMSADSTATPPADSAPPDGA